jgi:hypothetical protein
VDSGDGPVEGLPDSPIGYATKADILHLAEPIRTLIDRLPVPGLAEITVIDMPYQRFMAAINAVRVSEPNEDHQTIEQVRRQHAGEDPRCPTPTS